MSTMFVDRGGFLRDLDPRLEAWAVTLDRIELDVLRGERALMNDAVIRTDVWDVPADHGQLPESLRERAEGILARQQRLIEDFTSKLGRTARQRDLVDRVGRVSTLGDTQPIYLDATF